MDNKKKQKTVEERQAQLKQAFLAELLQMPIIQLACRKAGTSRATIYRWQDQDEEFKHAVSKALREGEELITDISESQLIALIRDKNFPAIQLWLRKHHPRYTDKVEVYGHIEHKEKRELSPEERRLIEKSLRLAMPKAGAYPQLPERSATQIDKRQITDGTIQPSQS